MASMIQRQRQIVAVPRRIRPRLRRSIANIRSLPSGSRRALSLASGRRFAIEKDVATLIFHRAGLSYALFQAGRRGVVGRRGEAAGRFWRNRGGVSAHVPEQ